MAQALDLPPLEAETILQALRPVVHDHVDGEVSGASIVDVDEDDQIWSHWIPTCVFNITRGLCFEQ